MSQKVFFTVFDKRKLNLYIFLKWYIICVSVVSERAWHCVPHLATGGGEAPGPGETTVTQHFLSRNTLSFLVRDQCNNYD